MTPEADHIAWLGRLYRDASVHESFDHDRSALAMAEADGQPSVRYVLVRRVDARGFAFFTHDGRRKASEFVRGAAAPAYQLVEHRRAIFNMSALVVATLNGKLHALMLALRLGH